MLSFGAERGFAIEVARRMNLCYTLVARNRRSAEQLKGGNEMPKTVKLLCAGILPLIVGWIFHFLLLYSPLPIWFYRLAGLALLAGWAYLSYRLSDFGKNPVLQAFFLSAFGLLMLVLALYQEIGMGQYWLNLAGVSTQLYFLPVLTFAASVTAPFKSITQVWPMYIVVWLFLFAAGCIGCYKKRSGMRG